MLWGRLSHSCKVIRGTYMGKQGPCYHCGITYTPLWRNGPPEKPVLCNACGSRWRTKGTLVNYTPLHARSFEATDSLDYKCAWGRKGSQKSKEQRSHKRKGPYNGGQDVEFGVVESDSQYPIDFEEDASNRTSSGSGISYSEGCVQYGGLIGRDATGSVHTNVWDSPVPSKKRSCMYRKRPSSVEKLTKGLRYILHEHNSSYISGSSEDLLFAYKAPMVAVEIGLGSVFIKQPQSTTREDESEASSLFIENKGYNTFDVLTQADSGAVAPSVQLQYEDKDLTGRGKEKVKQIMEKAELLQEHSDKSCMPNHVPLEDFPYNKHDVLQSRHSPLIVVELKDIINFDAFMGLLTVQEQTQLMKYASSVDVAGVPESLNCMFNSVQFEEALTNFQQLLSEGMFDFYGFGLSPQAQQILQKLILTDLTNSKWIERYSQPQNRNKRRRLFDSAKAIQNRETAKIKGSNLPSSVFSKSGAYVAPKNSSGWQPSQGIAGSENSMNSPANLQKTGTAITCPLTPVWANSGTTGIYHEITDSGCTSKELFEFDIGATNGSCFSPSSLFASPLQRSSSTVLDSTSTLSDEGFEQDLLLDVPSNMSFQQAELLHTPVWKCKNSKDSMPDGNNLENSNSRESMPNNLWGSEDSLEWSGLFWNSSCVGSGQTLPNGTVLYPEKMLP